MAARDGGLSTLRGGMIAANVAVMSTHPPTSRHIPEADLHRLRAALSRKRDELIAARDTSEAQRRGITDPESEEGDIAEQMIQQEAALRLGGFDADLLRDVERALKKLDDGDYGVSEDSGAPIPLERLEALPWARRTAQEEERHQARPPR
jgi:DnaK suppressor protein